MLCGSSLRAQIEKPVRSRLVLWASKYNSTAAWQHGFQHKSATTLTEAQRSRTLPQAYWRSEAANLEGAIPGTPLCKDPYAGALAETLLTAPELQMLRDVGDLEKEKLAIVEGVRCAFMDRFVMDSLKQRMRQVVVLGSGMDSRIFRLELPPQMRFVEVDEDAVHESKSATIPTLGARARCLVTRQAVCLNHDLTTADLVDAIAPAFNPNKPALFLLDGALSTWSRESCLAAVSAAAELAVEGSVIVGAAPQDDVTPLLSEAGFGQVNIINHHQLAKIYRRVVPESMQMIVAVHKPGEYQTSGCGGKARSGNAKSSSGCSGSGKGDSPSKAREINF